MDKIQPGNMRCIVDPKVFADYTGVSLRAVNLKRTDMGWQVILKAYKRDGDPVYSLYAAVELEDAIEGIMNLVAGKNGMRYWHHDRFG